MDFYTNPASPNCRKVNAVAKQLAIELDYKQIDTVGGENRKPEFLAINPNGKVPVLVNGDVTLWESNVIACYIASKTDNDMWPKGNLRYDIMRWQSWELAHFGAAARELTFERVIKPMFVGADPDPRICQDAEARFNRFAAVLDGHLDGKRFLVGGRLTVADFCVAAPLTYAAPARLPLEPYEHLRAWYSALDEQPGWRASSPPPM